MIEMPRCFFTSKTLVVLTLYHICVNTSAVCLPALKKLELRNVGYKSEESIEHLLSGCPALEDLSIVKMNDCVARLHISSPTLTRLFLRTYRGYYQVYYELKLDTPALEYLWLDDSSSCEFSVGMQQLASLTEADVVLNDQPNCPDYGLYARSVLEFVGKLNNVSSLKLQTWMFEVSDSALSAALGATEFRNLTKFEFVGDMDADWRFVTYFLENSDNLKVLIFNMFYDHQKLMVPKRVPVCLKYHLEKVRFEDFKCSEAEFNVVEYFLRNAKVLKTMEILCFSNSHHQLKKDTEALKKKKSEALRRIPLFERASEACQLAFH